MMISIYPIIQLILIAFILAGCTSNVPELLKQPPPDDVRVEEVQQQPDKLIGSQIRWGGQIIQVENLPQSTLIEVLSRQLHSSGKPNADSPSQGRFKISLTGFVEPKEFPQDRLITVSGKVSEMTSGSVGKFQYHYPVVSPSAYHIWPKDREYHHRPYYYDPFFYPWYPYWYRHPYYW